MSTHQLQKVETLEDRFAYVRDQAGLNWEAMSKALNIDAGQFSKIRRGLLPLSPKFLSTFSLTFHVPAVWLKHGEGELPKVALSTHQVEEPAIYRSKFSLAPMTHEELVRQYDSYTTKLQQLKDADPMRKVLLESIHAIDEEQDRRIFAEIKKSEDADKKTTALAQHGLAKILPEAQRRDAESAPSQTKPSTSDKAAAPKAPSLPSPAHPRTPPKQAPK